MKKWMHVSTLYQIWYLYLYIVVGQDRAITCVFCRDLHLTAMFFGLYKKICLKESEVCRKVILNKIIVLLVTMGSCCHTRFAICSFLSCPVAYLFILFYFICHTIITKNIGKEEKKKWRGDLTETIGAYERLGLLELWARAVSHQLKKRRRKVEDGKTYELFSYLLNNFNILFFLKRGERLRVDDLVVKFDQITNNSGTDSSPVVFA